ncbi:MAG: UTP--glucose-1-phosphate uridylyltransferase [Terriglobia bacterium]
MSETRTVRKAVLPVAGLGTRFLPATKAQPKEMLPLVDKPLIQYAVEEAVASGIEDIILVTGPGKEAIEDHFDSDANLVRLLEKRGKKEEAEVVRRVGQLANVFSVRQKKPLGLGHAVGCARDLVGAEPFAVILPDDIIDAPVPCTRQLLEVHAARGGCVVATAEVYGPAIERYGVMGVEPAAPDPGGARPTPWKNRLFRVTELVEKPKEAEAPSPYVVIGRYILEPEIFAVIDSTPPGRGGEIQLTDALLRFAREKAVYAFAFDGHHNDAGNKPGFLRATVHYALKHPELGPAFRDYLKSLKL